MTFLMIMMTSLSIILLSSDFVRQSSTVYDRLYQSIDDFEKEAQIIDELKCHLVNFENLDEFEYDGAIIYEYQSGYRIIYDNLDLLLKTNGKKIIDYSYN